MTITQCVALTRVVAAPVISSWCLLASCVLAVQALDESHTIANTTATAKVVKQLVANRRWCITGYVPSTVRSILHRTRKRSVLAL